ncbi:MAG TPA: polysaccharide pyruvyl transferase family protein [Rhizomicrobium sp.]|nr:polysaccharide pyruvyl transferase family protein [Rhizomicrobium sp.]
MRSDFERIVQETGAVPLTWDCSRATFPFVNLGDALGPVIVAAMAGLPVRHVGFKSRDTRLCSIGTIVHKMRDGTVHVWGTGVDARRNAMTPGPAEFEVPPETAFVVHAVRGPHSRDTFRRAGVEAPAIYGDPAWFLPRLMPATVEKTHELGVVLHVSELIERHPNSGPLPEFRRYAVPADQSGAVRIIATYHDPTLAALKSKLNEILACKRIVSTSFHGMMLADAYGIPCAKFSLMRGGGRLIDAFDEREQLDHRFADFYAGSGRRKVPAFCQDRGEPTDWAAVADFIDRSWQPIDNDFAALRDAFPLPLAVDPASHDWTGAVSGLDAFTL